MKHLASVQIGAAAAVAVCLALVSAPAAAQESDTTETREVELLEVGLLEGTIENGVRVNRLTEVRLRQGTTYLEAHQATEYIDAREYRFVGDVLIIDEGDTLSAREVFYRSAGKIGEAQGDVRLSDGEIVVVAPSGRYYVDEKRAVFEEGLRLVDSTAVVTSARGSFWSEEKRGAFAGNVELRERATYMASDSLTVLRETRRSYATGNVFIQRYGRDEEAESEIDSTTVTYLLGEEAFNDDFADSSRVAGDPVVMQVRFDSTGAEPDTTVIRAMEIRVARRDSVDRLVAIDSVRMWQASFAAVGDSASVVRQRLPDSTSVELLTLMRDPVAWFETSQVSGDTIRVVTGPAPTDTLFVSGNAFVAQEDTALQRVNQLSGRNLIGLFEDDSLRTLRVGPNANAIRYLADDQGALSWAVRSSGDEVVVHFLGEDRAEVAFGSGTEGRAYPPELIPEPFELDGFRWQPARRPTFAGLLDVTRVEARARRARESASAPFTQEIQPAF